MGIYHVELAENEKSTLIGMKLGKMLIQAGSIADARAIAKSFVSGDSKAAWDNATVTNIVTSITDYALASMRVQVLDASPVVDVKVTMPSGKVVSTVAINAGGTGYTVNDVLTISTGTKVRAATARVTSVSGGVVDGIELVDCGDTYSVDPTTTAVATTGGTGTGCTLDLTLAQNDYKNLMGAMVTALNATAINASAVDFGTGTNGTFTVTGTADSLGDKTIAAKLFMEADLDENAIPGLVSTLTHQGSAGAATSFLMVNPSNNQVGIIATY